MKWLKISIFIIYILLILFAGISCNPVKQVLKNREYFDEVAKEVVKSGYCANDTIIKVKSDTTYKLDTLYETSLDTIKLTDKIYIPKISQRTIVKTITIHDTIKSVVVDNARLNALQGDLTALNEKYINTRKQAQSRLNWLILLLIAILVYSIRKPIIKLIKWHFFPM